MKKEEVLNLLKLETMISEQVLISKPKPNIRMMKKHIFLSIILVFAVMFTACTKEMRENLNELSTYNISEATEETKNNFLAEINEELERTEIVLDEIENEIKKTSEKLDVETRNNLEDLKKERLKLEQQIGILKNISKENWEIAKESFVGNVDEFKDDFNSFLDDLKIG